jgi:anti-sigma factor RsiW
MSLVNTLQLLHECGQGDALAIERLVNEYQPIIFRLACSILGRRQPRGRLRGRRSRARCLAGVPASLSWSENGVGYTIEGYLPQDELIAIAESLR